MALRRVAIPPQGSATISGVVGFRVLQLVPGSTYQVEGSETVSMIGYSAYVQPYGPFRPPLFNVLFNCGGLSGFSSTQLVIEYGTAESDIEQLLSPFVPIPMVIGGASSTTGESGTYQPFQSLFDQQGWEALDISENLTPFPIWTTTTGFTFGNGSNFFNNSGVPSAAYPGIAFNLMLLNGGNNGLTQLGGKTISRPCRGVMLTFTNIVLTGGASPTLTPLIDSVDGPAPSGIGNAFNRLLTPAACASGSGAIVMAPGISSQGFAPSGLTAQIQQSGQFPGGYIVAGYNIAGTPTGLTAKATLWGIP